MLANDDQPDRDLRTTLRHAIANLHPRPADITALLDALADPALLPEVLALLGDVHEVTDTYVVDDPVGRARVYVVRADRALNTDI